MADKTPSFSELMEMISAGRPTNDVLEYAGRLEESTLERVYSINPDILANRYATETKDIFSNVMLRVKNETPSFISTHF